MESPRQGQGPQCLDEHLQDETHGILNYNIVVKKNKHICVIYIYILEHIHIMVQICFFERIPHFEKTQNQRSAVVAYAMHQHCWEHVLMM